MRRETAVALIAASIVLAVALGAWLILNRGNGSGSGSGIAGIGGPFTLVDQHGKTVTDRDFQGRFKIVYFGYTFCPDVCPTELQTIAGALDKLGRKADSVVPIFITIDPERDTPKVLSDYLKNFDPRFVGLTGTSDQIAQVAKEYRVYYAKSPGQGAKDYTMDHTGIVYFMGRDGRFLTHFSMNTSPDEMAEKIRSYL